MEQKMSSFNCEKTASIIIIDDNDLDLFINKKLLETFGITHIVCFKSANSALDYLQKTNVNYSLILTDIYLPIMNGFEFIDKFKELKLNKKHGKVCLLSASLDPLHKKLAKEKNIRFIEKPMKIDSLFFD